MSQRIHFVSLGCPKNRVDSEVMLGVATDNGATHTSDPNDADVIVVNTCGFIDSAKEESIETIFELAKLKEAGRCKTLVVAGCLSQRYGREMAQEMPEVDHFLGSSDMLKLGEILRGSASRHLVGSPAEWLVSASDPRRVSTHNGSAYVKIAEGCNRSCSFCVIPNLRGKQRSRTVDDVVAEVQQLAAQGVVEINLVSQDTVSFGRDRGSAELETLIGRVSDVPGVEWVRVFYLYPEKLTDGVIDLIASHPKVVPYIDMPLQHAADGMLRRMRRGHGGDRLRELVTRLKSKIDDVVFRTAFIVGHPGESQEEFDELVEFVRWAEFDRVGVFHYSDEAECRSHAFDNKVERAVAEERAALLMEVQREISIRKNAALVGRQVSVLVEGKSDESDWVMRGRWRGQAPDIDGCVYISGGPVYPGQLVPGVVESSTDYDLVVDVGELDDAPPPHPPSMSPIVGRHTDGRLLLRTLR